jgi:SpoVK/Ycf46/Vps4 family AAA+-type ATPase
MPGLFLPGQAPLFKNSILQYIEDPREPDKPLITRDLKVNSRIIDFILDNPVLDEEISLLAEISDAKHTLQDTFVSPDKKEKISGFIDFFNKAEEKGNFIFSFTGPCHAQKLEITQAICNEIGMPLLKIDLLMLYNSGVFFEKGIELIIRESILFSAAVYYTNCDFLFSDSQDEVYLKKIFINNVNKYSKIAFLCFTHSFDISEEFSRQRVIYLDFKIPDYLTRKEIWDNYLKKVDVDHDMKIKELAGKFRLTGKQIQSVISTASTNALWSNPREIKITGKDLHDAVQFHTTQQLSNFARKIKTEATLDDIILPDNIKNKLKDIIDMVLFKHVVYNEWDFEKKFSLGKGVSAMFFGNPGTGKTMACGIIAHELDMNLYKIDVSSVISKYIGDTEKNLNKIFNAAENSNAILFFDEADALFGKRTEINDSHDRYANIEISYLLQKIEEFTGIVILATNFNINIDEAFERRFHFIINFPLPNKEQRLLIWKNIFPKAAPLDGEIDFDFLAEKIDVSGGHIRNIAFSAAFLAAKSNSTIKMKHLLFACEEEYKKMGRIWNINEYTQ